MSEDKGLALADEAKYPVRYTEELAERICALFASGATMSAISRMPEMPSLETLYRWVQNNKVFREMLDDARATRAFSAEDRIADLAELPIDKDSAPGERLRFDALKFLAEVNNPARYGKKTTISGDKNNPVVLVVQTGVPEPVAPAIELTADGLVKEVESEVTTPDAEFTDV